MAIIKRKIENLKPGKEYLVTVRGKNADINTSAELAEAIRFTVPQDDTQPSAITNLALYQSLQNVMFVFDFVNDADIARYEYELYNGNTTSSSLISTGFNDANVFTVSVENLYANSGLGTGLIPFWGRVRAVDTSGNNGTWTSLTPTSGDVPLIDSQYIGSLTASKITAGDIGAQTIRLSGANSILRSSVEYSGLPAWIIRGDGSAEFRNVTVGGSSNIAGISIGNGKIYIGAGNFGNSDTSFYVDSAGQFSLKNNLTWDGTNLLITGAITATSGTFTGAVNATSGNFTGSVSISSGGDIRSGQTAYDSGTGFFLGSPSGNPRFSIGNSAGNKMTWDGTTLNIVGTITGTLTGSIDSSGATITGGILRTATTGNRIEISGSNIDVYGQTSKINYKDDTSSYIQYSGARGVTINGAYGSLKVGHQTGVGFEGIYATATELVNIQVGSSPSYKYMEFDKSNPWGFTGILDVYESVDRGIALVANRGDGFSTLHHHDYLDSTTAYLLASAGASHTFISSPSGYGLRLNPSEQGGQSVEINAVGDVFRVVVGNATGFRVDTGPNTYSNITATSTGSSVRYTVISGNEVRFERVTSLRRLKSDIKDFTNGLDLVRKMQPRFFKWNRMDQDNDYSAALRECHVDIGFIAEEMEEIDPRFATYKGNVFDAAKDSDVESLELEAWSETRVVVSAIAAIKELDTLLRDLINRIENIETIIKKSK